MPPAPATPTTSPVVAQANQPCPQSLHDQWLTKGPDGKDYPTWHPAVDPTFGCYYGHEHGADPSTSGADNSPPAFGYAAALMGMSEPHVGFKVFILNTGTIAHDGIRGGQSPSPADYRIVFHMGTGGVARYSSQFHSIEYDYVARDGSGRYAHIYGMADTGPTSQNGSTCDFPRRGAKDFSTVGCQDPYEIWNFVHFQVMHPDDPFQAINSSRVGLSASLAVEDPITTRDPADLTRLLYSQQYYNPGIDPLSPQAQYLGCKRDAYNGPTFFKNAGKPNVYYTDPMGNVKPGPGPGLIKQEISSVESNNNEFYAVGPLDFCDPGIHAPN